jgi:predicted Fe-S protein YdhL (DUF1289 family)
MRERATHRLVNALVGVVLLLATVLPAQARPMRGARPVQNWQDLSPNDRQRALQNLQRYQRLPEQSRQRMDRSYENWRQLDPGERARVQQNYQKYQQMTPDQRRDFENKYKRWKGGKGD